MILKMHEDKRVNKHCRILKMDYKRQTAVLSVMFILVGMMFLVPVMTEKALAMITARAHTGGGSYFSNLRWHLDAGHWSSLPHLVSPAQIYWKTFPPSAERGLVEADWNLGSTHFRVGFDFNSPASGIGNSCSVDPPSVGYCTIPRVGGIITATYHVLIALPGANGGDANGGDEGDNSGDTP
jgi:hypothetical protein